MRKEMKYCTSLGREIGADGQMRMQRKARRGIEAEYMRYRSRGSICVMPVQDKVLRGWRECQAAACLLRRMECCYERRVSVSSIRCWLDECEEASPQLGYYSGACRDAVAVCFRVRDDSGQRRLVIVLSEVCGEIGVPGNRCRQSQRMESSAKYGTKAWVWNCVFIDTMNPVF